MGHLPTVGEGQLEFQVPDDLPHAALVRESAEGWMADGGSCVAGPDGNWLIEPQVGEEGLFYADASIETVARERQNFDVAGHYSRPDVTRLKVKRKRQVRPRCLRPSFGWLAP